MLCWVKGNCFLLFFFFFYNFSINDIFIVPIKYVNTLSHMFAQALLSCYPSPFHLWCVILGREKKTLPVAFKLSPKVSLLFTSLMHGGHWMALIYLLCWCGALLRIENEEQSENRKHFSLASVQFFSVYGLKFCNIQVRTKGETMWKLNLYYRYLLTTGYKVQYDLLRKNLTFGRNLQKTDNLNISNYQVPFLI